MPAGAGDSRAKGDGALPCQYFLKNVSRAGVFCEELSDLFNFYNHIRLDGEIVEVGVARIDRALGAHLDFVCVFHFTGFLSSCAPAATIASRGGEGNMRSRVACCCAHPDRPSAA